MEKKNIHQEFLMSQLEKAVEAGDTERADRLVDALYPEDAPSDIKMPEDFPLRAVSAAEKGRVTMKKTSVLRKAAATAAAVALVLSLGVTAYAQGWFEKPISVLEEDNIIAAGDVSEDRAEALLTEDEAMKEIYEQTEFTPYPDFRSACEGIGLPYVYPAYLEEHAEFASEDGAVAVTNPQIADKQVYDDYFAPSGKGISVNLAYCEKEEDVLAAYDSHLQVENTRVFTTSAGDTFTLCDVRYTDSSNDKLVEARIGINNYLFEITFCNLDEDEMETVLSGIDLSPLKN